MRVNKRDLTNDDREAILREILLNSSKTSFARLSNGIAQVLAEKYNCHHSTIRRVFSQAKEQGVTTGNMKVSVLTVTKDVYRAFLVEKVLPVIVSKWPCPKRLVHLQHDNARAHVTTPDDAKLLAAFASYSTSGWTFAIKPQPPNSPDMKILDLGFFAAIQSLQHRTSARTIDDLITNVHAAFDTYPVERLDRTFMTLQACLVETMKCFGENAYKVPHLSKEKQARQELLPENVRCPADTYDSVQRSLDSVDCTVMEKKFQEELDEARSMHELAQELERIALCDDETVDELMAEVGIDPISIDNDE
ncbi:hypothetical protein DYB26_012031 [Aphanomyces astaci]|uniref:Uncharacterized protein n=1 Tax=Aphanomyces astaci TaxID=112090 RepID=A0A397F4R1_APHAT|nr:hypothetical protein DYB31_015447 [Aphanomyces astaci]RHZ31162.1 hypothetical protein DYB26_012031 [Aphanomyces astaci]